MIPSPEYGKPLDDMEVANYCPIRLPTECEVVTYGPRGASPTVSQPSRPSLPTSIAGQLQHEAIAGQAPSLLVAVSKPIEKPKPTTGMILAPNCNNLMRAIHSAGFNASLQLPIDHNRVQFCTSYHLSGHCNDNCMRRAWHRALTSTKTAQHNIFYDCMCPHLQFQNRGMVAQLAGKCTQWEINPIQGLSSTHTSNYLAAFSHKVCT